MTPLRLTLAFLLAAAPVGAVAPECEPPKLPGRTDLAASVGKRLLEIRDTDKKDGFILEPAADACSGEGTGYKLVKDGENIRMSRVEFKLLTEKQEVDTPLLMDLARFLKVPGAPTDADVARLRERLVGLSADLARTRRELQGGEQRVGAMLTANTFEIKKGPGDAPETAPKPLKVVAQAAQPPKDEGLFGFKLFGPSPTDKGVPTPAPKTTEQSMGSHLTGFLTGLGVIAGGALLVTAAAASTPAVVVGGVLIVGGVLLTGYNMKGFLQESFGGIGDILSNPLGKK